MGSRHIDGFSLIEILIAIAILGILAAIAVPTIQRYMADAKSVEGELMSKQIVDRIKVYFNQERADDSGFNTERRALPPGAGYPVNGGGTSGTHECCSGRTKCDPDMWASSPAATDWQAIGAIPAKPFHGAYGWFPLNNAGPKFYRGVLVSITDLDCDQNKMLHFHWVSTRAQGAQADAGPDQDHLIDFRRQITGAGWAGGVD